MVPWPVSFVAAVSEFVAGGGVAVESEGVGVVGAVVGDVASGVWGASGLTGFAGSVALGVSGGETGGGACRSVFGTAWAFAVRRCATSHTANAPSRALDASCIEIVLS